MWFVFAENYDLCSGQLSIKLESCRSFIVYSHLDKLILYTVLHLTAGSDYTPVSTHLVFVSGSGVGAETCTFTQVMSDSILESAEETFSIQASSSKGQSQLVNIPADQQVTLVTIVDTNSKCE